MMKGFRYWFLSLGLWAVPAFSIFEWDDRYNLERYPLQSPARNVALSVALITSPTLLEWESPRSFKLKTKSRRTAFKESEEPLCEGSRFQEEPVVSGRAGTGFLVGPDLLATAGHVIENEKDCSDSAVIFGYGYFEPWVELGKVKEENLYFCKEIVFTQNNPDGDIALIRLDRKVVNRSPLKFRRSGNLNLDTLLWMAGHPSGLPLKVTEAGKLLPLEEANFFTSELDTFSGNSGSPIFDPKTGDVEGVLVEGELTEMTIQGDWLEGCYYEKVFCSVENKEKVRCDALTTEDFTFSRATRIHLLWPYLN